MDGAWRGDGICYGPHRDGQRPGGPGPSSEQLREDLRIMRPHWRIFRLYAVGDETETVLRTIRDEHLGMKVLLGAWIDPEQPGDSEHPDAQTQARNRRQLELAGQLANRYPEVVLGISVGNETQVSWSSHRVRPEVLVAYVRQVRATTSVPITVADDYTFWLEPRAAQLAREVDFIHAHIYAMWRGKTLDEALPFTQMQYAALTTHYPKHPIIIGELGWATQMHSAGDQAKYIKGRAGMAEQTAFYDAFLTWARRKRVAHFWFEAFDENWKGGPHPNEVEKHWGVFNSDRSPKAAMQPMAVWARRVRALDWICYSPTNADPDAGQMPTIESIRADLAALRTAGFSGLITYGSDGVRGRDLPKLAVDAGFSGLIMGVWDPTSAEELAAARNAAQLDEVYGYCVGNEGLRGRYKMDALRNAIAELKRATGKPVTTTEEIDDYADPALRAVGDWVFPNAHPVFHGRVDPDRAADWTVGAYDEQVRLCKNWVWFKEVGLPTGGDENGILSPAAQVKYYTALAKTPVIFAYFEAFDQPWKDWRPFETQWGLFTAEREPKLLARQLIKSGFPERGVHVQSRSAAATETDTPRRATPFWVYRDAESPENHFEPSGLDGDTGDVMIDAHVSDRPHSGTTCLKLVYTAKGTGPHKCAYDPPCRWAGIRWLHPAKNWGDKEEHAGAGFDLRGYHRLTFWARADKPTRAQFMVGGLDTPYGDSLAYPHALVAELETTWRQFEIDLKAGDLSHIIAGFGWSTNWDLNPDGCCIYLDDIRFE